MLQFLVGNKTWNVWSGIPEDEAPRAKRRRVSREKRSARIKALRARREQRRIMRDEKLRNAAYKMRIQTQETRKGGKLILNAGESLTLAFEGESFQRPTEVEIYGIYKMLIKGVKPIGKLNLTIVPEQEEAISEAVTSQNPG